MLDLTGVTHHPVIEEIVEVLCKLTRKTDRRFFRVVTAYFAAKAASNMRATIVTEDRGEIPVNLYALCLATSGYGKNHSVNILENSIMKGFKERFTQDTLPVIADKTLWVFAAEKALRNGTDAQDEFDKLEVEYKRQGTFAYTFDNGTPPAVKQLRHKLLLANCGAINFQVDEIGSNLLSVAEMLTLFLELYDQGMTKPKLTKNTAENVRGEDLDGKTPANMLLFGTPARLLDGGPVESAFNSMLDTGYARRCLFAFGENTNKAFITQSSAEIFRHKTEPANNATLARWAAHFTKLADPAMHNWKMTVNDAVAIELIEYQTRCEQKAEKFGRHEEVRKNEMMHRYFKALKLAGTFAFVDHSNEIEMDHLLQAILLTEESGESFEKIMAREPSYVRIAKYISTVGHEVTHADLMEALPFYKGGVAARNDQIHLAATWGYKEHIVIKKRFSDNIEFISADTLEKTDTDKIIVSYSDDWAYNYGCDAEGGVIPFNQLHLLTQAEGQHWCNHQFKGGHRANENVFAGFNLIVIDADGSISLDAFHELFKEYKFMTYTTKRHQTADLGDRFRIIMPTNYKLHLDVEDYREFMRSFLDWLPFDSDRAGEQICKKWMSHEKGTYHYNMEGNLLDILPFIPKTTRNEKHKEGFASLVSLDNMERWFAQRMAEGNRNNLMIKYALALVDGNMDLISVGKQVHAFNKKLSSPMTEGEIDSTIMQTVAKRFTRQAA